MKVVLVSANTETTPYPVYPLGIDYVAGAIRYKHMVYVEDINETGGNEVLADRIGSIDPDVIGISIRNIDNTDVKSPKAYIDPHRALICAVRKVSGAPVVLGGSGFTLFPGRLMEALGADYGIVGEGERFAAFLDALEKHDDVCSIEGVIAGSGEPGRISPQPWTGGVKRYFDPETPHVAYYLKKGGMLNLQTQRGCPFNCIYCTYPHIEGRHLRQRSPGAVADTARALQDAGAGYLFITDSVFNADPAHSMEVARAFQKAGVTIPWGAYIAPVQPRSDYFRVLADAGMTHVEFGTEAFCDKILENYRKPFRTDDVFAAHKAAVDAGLNAAHFFLLGAPAETLHTLETTLDNARGLEKTVCFFFAGIRIYPHTRLSEIAVASGQIESGRELFTPCFFEPKGIGLEQIGKILREKSKNRMNWVFGAGGEKTAKILSRLHDRGHVGPLWEHLIR
ncbi:MAG: radical SAM protein [Desulfobacteraceae bacterium]|nr:radical SAM protein [Desulfobacteraceae bacterium]